MKAEIEQLKNILKLKELELQKFSGKIALISEYEAKCNIFSIEISRLKEITVDKDQQISAFTLKISEYEKQILNLNLEISHLKQLISEKDNKSIEEYENRIAMLTSEIDRLKFQVSKKEKESVLKINEYEIKISTLISELEQSTLKFQGFKENDNRISILNIEIEKLKGFLSQKEEEISTLKQKIGRYSDYEKTIFLLYSEIDRLKLIMNEKDNEFKLKIDEYSIKFSNYSDLIFNNQKYTLEINNNKEKIITLENQLVLITKEYDKLKYSSNNEQELNSLKIKYSILEKNLIELKGIESRFRSSEEILFSFKEKNMKQLMIILLLCAEVDRLRENELIS